MYKKFLILIWETVKVVAISLAIIIPVRYFLIQPFYVKGASMESSFHDHEYLIIDEISYRFRTINRGEVIVFRYPLNPQEYFIKRVIALPGEGIQVKDGKVIIYNDEYPGGLVLKESYLDKNTPTYSNLDDKVILNDDEYFVMGDNRTASKDSRSFGPVNKSFITGRVFLRGWPFDRATIFNDPVDYSIDSFTNIE
ncbi:signal peptidase I [Patescibacteria group bacterium]|nr:signal peptidase I [Patescibacteria group bacterium]